LSGASAPVPASANAGFGVSKNFVNFFEDFLKNLSRLLSKHVLFNFLESFSRFAA